MKIVLNKCYGGFGLSHVAKMELFKKRGIEVFPYIYKWDGGEVSYERYSLDKLDNSLMTSITYFQKDPKIDSFIEEANEKSEYAPIYLDFDYEDRGNEDLVEVVEKLGELAGGRFSELRVVDIPNGASYEISDYDGIETAHYGFQTGSV